MFSGCKVEMLCSPSIFVSLMAVERSAGDHASKCLASANKQYIIQVKFICSVLLSEPINSFFRLGWLIRFISHSVISGFTTSSAIVIALSQAKYFLGYDVDGSSKIIPVVTSIINGLDKVCLCLISSIN